MITDGVRTIIAVSGVAETGILPRCYADVQKESIWQWKSETAGASGGAREGRPRDSRIFRVVSGG